MPNAQVIMAQTERLVIRLIALQDADVLFSYRSLPEIYQFQSWQPKEKDEAVAFIESVLSVPFRTIGSWSQLAICLRSGEMIGDIGIHALDEEQIEIGYTLSPAHQRNGYAREAVRAAIRAAFVEWRIQSIRATVDPQNARSIRLLEFLGFQKDAHFCKSYYMGGSWCDNADLVYRLNREDWIVERVRNAN